MGSIYRPKYKDRNGEKRESSLWWIKFYSHGRAIRESTETADHETAKEILKKREGESVDDLHTAASRKTVFEELAKDHLTDYRVNHFDSIDDLQRRYDLHILPIFGKRKASSIDTAEFRRFIAMRQDAGAANGEIVQELNAIKRAYNLGLQSGRIRIKPFIPSVKVNNVRKGFFEREQFESVWKHLPEHLKGPATFSYITGWRKNEVLSLQWPQVDFEAGRVRLEPGTTKNDQAREFPFIDELRALMEEQKAKAEALQKEKGIICPWVFPSRRRKRIVDYKRAWRTACEKAGVPGRIFHDFRRTAVRNLERAGVPRSVAMKLTGHKTESVYRRYDIVSESDLDIAAAKLEQFAGKDTGKDKAKSARIGKLQAVK